MKILIVAPPETADRLVHLMRNLGCEPSLATSDISKASGFLDARPNTDFVVVDEKVHGFNLFQLRLAFVRSRRAHETRVFAIGADYCKVLGAAVVAAKRHERPWDRGPQFETPLDVLRTVFKKVLADSRGEPATRRELFPTALSR